MPRDGADRCCRQRRTAAEDAKEEAEPLRADLIQLHDIPRLVEAIGRYGAEIVGPPLGPDD